MTFDEKQALLQKIDFYDLDFKLVPALLGEYLKQIHDNHDWDQPQVALLMGKNRSHVNKAYRNTPNMPFTEIVKHYIVSDIDMNDMMGVILTALLKAPRVLKK
jgi:hypothetical protein